MLRLFLRLALYILSVAAPVQNFASEWKRVYLASYPRSGNYWVRFCKYWNKKSNVVTIRYEDLLVDPVNVFGKAMQALGFKLDPSNYKRAVAKYPPQGAMLKHRDQFSEKELALIYKKLAIPMRQFHYF